MRKLIVMSGFAGAGKSTFSNSLYFLLQLNNYKAMKLSFGTRLKEIFSELKGKSTEQLFGDPTIKNKNRADLVDFAENCKKMFSDDVWAKVLINHINLIPEDVLIIIDDLRFNAEHTRLIEFIQDKDAVLKIVKIERQCIKPLADIEWYKQGKIRGILTGDQIYQYYNCVDPNEIAWNDRIGQVITNNGTAEELHKKAVEVLKDLNFQIKTERIKANV